MTDLPYTVVCPASAPSDKWLEARTQLFGASDVAHLFDECVENMREYGGAMARFEDSKSFIQSKALGLDKFDESQQRRMGYPTWWGNQLEDDVLEALNQLAGFPCMPWQDLIAHIDYPHHGATCDAVGGYRCVVEIKAPSGQSKYRGYWREYAQDEVIPELYRYQLQAQMSVSGAEVGVLAVVFGGRGIPKVVPMARDERLISLIRERCEEAWTEVEAIRNRLDGAKQSKEMVKW